MLRETQSQVDELQARTEASSAERVVEVELLVANAEQEARVESERILAEARGRRARRSSPAPRTRGGHCSSRSRRPGAGCWPTWRRGGARSGSRLSSCVPPATKWPRPCSACATRWTGSWRHLERTDDEARAAAAAVGDQFRLHGADEGPHDQDSVDERDGGDAGGAVRDGDGRGGRARARTTPAAPAATPSVDELFARIRAGTGGRQRAHRAAGAPEGHGRRRHGGRGRRRPPATPSAEPRPRLEADVAPGPDDELVARRDELLAPVTARLGRTVKRALGDDQNRLLDRLRNAPSLTADELLGPEDEHMAAFAAAARSHLAEAFTAGAAFGGAGAAAVARRRRGRAVGRGTGARHRDHAAPPDRGRGRRARPTGSGAAFREWRGERVERLAGDYATQAFSAGVTAAAGDDKVRWVVTSASGCSDCEDNALAGAMSASETFPTGHAHPPAHSGCRCLVAPADD